MRGKSNQQSKCSALDEHGGASSGARAQYSACTGELVPLLTSSVSRQTARVMIWKREKKRERGEAKRQKSKNVAYLVQAKCDVKGRELVYCVPFSLGIGNNR